MEEYKGRAIICIRIGGGGRNPTLSRKNWPDGWRGSRFFPIARFLDFLVDLGREESTDYFLSPLSLSLSFVRLVRSLFLSCSFARLLSLFFSFARLLSLSLSVARSLFLSLVRMTHLLSLFLICSLASSFSVPHNSLARLLFLCPARFARLLSLFHFARLACSLFFSFALSFFLSFPRSLAFSFSLVRTARSLSLSFSTARLDRVTWCSIVIQERNLWDCGISNPDRKVLGPWVTALCLPYRRSIPPALTKLDWDRYLFSLPFEERKRSTSFNPFISQSHIR